MKPLHFLVRTAAKLFGVVISVLFIGERGQLPVDVSDSPDSVTHMMLSMSMIDCNFAICFGQVVEELKTLACTLLETINDKNLALSHQRKSNK